MLQSASGEVKFSASLSHGIADTWFTLAVRVAMSVAWASGVENL